MTNDLTGLAFEYQADYGRASGDLRVTYLMNNPCANGICRVFGLSFKEESAYGVRLEVGSFGNDLPDADMIGLQAAQAFPQDLFFEDLPEPPPGGF